MTSQPANHEIAGYMPGRLEFETEYENEAEQSVKDMLFSEEDAPEEVGMSILDRSLYSVYLSTCHSQKQPFSYLTSDFYLPRLETNGPGDLQRQVV